VSAVGGWLKAFALFWWDFIVGDDWRIAAGVVVALALTAALAHAAITAWWLLPLAAVAMLALSLRSARRAAGPASPTD
jgi:hypothetical protein